MTENNKILLTEEEAYGVLEILDALFEQADADCPPEYRTEHFRNALHDAEDALCKYGLRIKMEA